MSVMAQLVRNQVGRAMSKVRQAFRATAAGNTHGPLIGVEMEGLAGESVSGELFQHYGFSSAPLAGAEYVVIPMGGNTNHSIVIASEDGRYRLQLKDGEVSLYTDEGTHIHMQRGRVIEVVADELLFKVKNKVLIVTPLVEMSGDLHVEGNIKADGEIEDHVRTMQLDRELYNQHGHPSGNPPKPLQ